MEKTKVNVLIHFKWTEMKEDNLGYTLEFKFSGNEENFVRASECNRPIRRALMNYFSIFLPELHYSYKYFNFREKCNMFGVEAALYNPQIYKMMIDSIIGENFDEQAKYVEEDIKMICRAFVQGIDVCGKIFFKIGDEEMVKIVPQKLFEENSIKQLVNCVVQ